LRIVATYLAAGTAKPRRRSSRSGCVTCRRPEGLAYHAGEFAYQDRTTAPPTMAVARPVVLLDHRRLRHRPHRRVGQSRVCPRGPRRGQSARRRAFCEMWGTRAAAKAGRVSGNWMSISRAYVYGGARWLAPNGVSYPRLAEAEGGTDQRRHESPQRCAPSSHRMSRRRRHSTAMPRHHEGTVTNHTRRVAAANTKDSTCRALKYRHRKTRLPNRRSY
jgi:hypothetical protein